MDNAQILHAWLAIFAFITMVGDGVVAIRYFDKRDIGWGIAWVGLTCFMAAAFGANLVFALGATA